MEGGVMDKLVTQSKSSVDVNARDRPGNIVLCQAEEDALQTLDLPIHVHDLVAAAEGGLMDKVVAELKRGVDVNARDYSGNTALDQASEYGHADVVKVLLEHGAIPDATASGGRTPLMAAAANGNSQVAELLLAGGANINLPDRKGCTPLIAAAEDGHLEIARLLLSRGANVNLKDQKAAMKNEILFKGNKIFLRLTATRGAIVGNSRPLA